MPVLLILALSGQGERVQADTDPTAVQTSQPAAAVPNVDSPADTPEPAPDALPAQEDPSALETPSGQTSKTMPPAGEAHKSVLPQPPVAVRTVPATALPPNIAGKTLSPKPSPPPLPHVRMETLVYGRSVRQTPLTAYVLDNGPDAELNQTLIFGGFHGNERATPGVVLRMLAFLRTHPDTWRGRRVILAPYANPDGWAAATRPNAHGVDLNRNFPANWSSVGRAVRYSPGQTPASEPETRAMMNLIQHFRPAKVISLHSPLHCLNWTGPVGLAMAEAMHRHDGLPVKSYIGYPTPGSLGNYCGQQDIGIVTVEFANQSSKSAWNSSRDALMAAVMLPVGSRAASILVSRHHLRPAKQHQ